MWKIAGLLWFVLGIVEILVRGDYRIGGLMMAFGGYMFGDTR